MMYHATEHLSVLVLREGSSVSQKRHVTRSALEGRAAPMCGNADVTSCSHAPCTCRSDGNLNAAVWTWMQE